MNKLVATILVAGDTECGKLKFIEKFLARYPGDPLILELSHDRYECEGMDQVIHLYTIKDKSIVENPNFFAKVDMILFSHTSENPETFRSLQETWIPRLKKFKMALVIDNAVQRNNLTGEQEKVLKEFGIGLSAAYSSEYQEVFSKLENILREKSTQIQSDSDIYIPDIFSENLNNSNNLSTVEPAPNVYSAIEFKPIAHSTPRQSSNESSTDESIFTESSLEKMSLDESDTIQFIPNNYSSVKIAPKKRDSVELIASDSSTVEIVPRKRDSVDSIPSDCPTEEIVPRKRDSVESIPSDCTRVELVLKKYSSPKLITNNSFTDELYPDEYFRCTRPGRCSPDVFFGSEQSSSHSLHTSLDTVPSNMSTPDASFSPHESSPENLTTNKCFTAETNSDECFPFQSKPFT